MANTAAPVLPEQHFILWNLSPSPAQRRLVLAVVLDLLIAFVITAGPLSTIQLGQIDAFVPAYATAIFVTELLTPVLLFAQFYGGRALMLEGLGAGQGTRLHADRVNFAKRDLRTALRSEFVIVAILLFGDSCRLPVSLRWPLDL